MFNQLLQKKEVTDLRIRTCVTFYYTSYYSDQIFWMVQATIYVSEDLSSYSLVLNDSMNLATWNKLICHRLNYPRNCSMSFLWNSLITHAESRKKLVDLILHKKPDQFIWGDNEDVKMKEEEYYYV